MDNGNNLGKSPSFWQRPEGWLGMVTVLGLGVGAVFFLSWLAPFLVNAVYAVIAGGSLLAIAWLAMNPKVRNLVKFLFKVIMRKLTGLVVELDPIAIMEGHVEQMEKQLENMEEGIRKLKGQSDHIRRISSQNRAETREAIAMFRQAMKEGKQELKALNARKFDRLQKQFAMYVELFKSLEKARVALEKLDKIFKVQIEDKQHQIKISKEEWAASKAARSALASARAILSGASSGELYDQAMEYIQRSWDQNLADISTLSNLSDQLVSSLEAQDNMRVDQLTTAIDNYEKQFNTAGTNTAALEIAGPDMDRITELEQAMDLPDAHLLSGDAPEAPVLLPKPPRASGDKGSDEFSVLDQYNR